MTKLRLILLAGVLGIVVVLPGCRSAHTTSAILYIDEQNYDKAIAVIHEGFEFRDDEPDAYYYLGEAHSKLAEKAIDENDYLEAKKNYELSYEYYSRSKEIDPEHFTEMANVAMEYNFTTQSNTAKGEFAVSYYEEAEGFFRLAYAALPDSLSAIKNIARMKMKHASEVGEDLGMRETLLEEALVLVDQVLDAHPDVYDLQADKASVLKHLGRTTEADIIYKRLLEEHGDDPGLLHDVAELARSENDQQRAADLYVRIVGIYENDTDPSNDEAVKPLLLFAGTIYGTPSVQRFEEAIELLNRAAEKEIFGAQESTLLVRMQTYYHYGKHLQDQAAEETDPVRKAELEQLAAEMFQRGVEIGNALTNQYPGSAEGFLFLALCQVELGDTASSEINLKAYEELSTGTGTP